jgi:hypothetical protein
MLRDVLSTKQLASVEFPTPTLAELRDLHQKGIQRWGIAAVALAFCGDDEPRLLVQRYSGSDKVAFGAWGGLAETSQVACTPKGLRLEPTAATLYRGIQEETGISATEDDLSVPTSHAWFDSRWPVGLNYPGQWGGVRSTVTVLSPEVADKIVDSPATEESISRTFMRFSEANALVAQAEAGKIPMRAGFGVWLGEVEQHLKQTDLSTTVPLLEPAWQYAASEITDAVLKNIFYDENKT